MENTHNSIDNTQNDLMDDILAIRDELWAQEEAEIAIIAGELSEEFAMADPDLAALHKDMKQAANQLSKARKDNHMVGIMKWRYESAETAYQTRLLEVRRSKMRSNDKAVADEAMQNRRELHELSMQQKMNEEFAQLREKRLKEKRRKQRSGAGSWLFFFFLGMWIAQMNANRLEQDRLRHSFANAKLT